MSHDLKLFFPHAEFPIDAWYELIESFRSDDVYVKFADREDTSRLDECSIYVDQSAVDIEQGPVTSECAPKGTRWEVWISTIAGRSTRAYFIEHAVPYHALVFFPGITVHDCQYHVGRTVEASSWNTPEAWLAYAGPMLWRLGPKETLIELGLFTPEGIVRF